MSCSNIVCQSRMSTFIRSTLPCVRRGRSFDLTSRLYAAAPFSTSSQYQPTSGGPMTHLKASQRRRTALQSFGQSRNLPVDSLLTLHSNCRRSPLRMDWCGTARVRSLHSTAGTPFVTSSEILQLTLSAHLYFSYAPHGNRSTRTRYWVCTFISSSHFVMVLTSFVSSFHDTCSFLLDRLIIICGTCNTSA